MTSASDIQVTIAGLGIAGSLLAILLERGGINYVVLERSNELTTFGSSMTMTASAIRVFDQLGLLEELRSIAIPITALRYYKQDHTDIGRMDVTSNKDRFGYESLVFPRPELLKLLVSNIPKEKIHWDKKIARTSQDDRSVKILCADGTEYECAVLVGADGAYSAVRQSMYKNLLKKGVPLSSADLAPLNFQMHCNVGIATNLDPETYPVLKSSTTEMHVTIGDTYPYTLWVVAMKNNKIAWTLGGELRVSITKTKGSHDKAEWEYHSAQGLPQAVRSIKLTIGGTLGDLMDKTEMISSVNLEEKLYVRWYDGRTILIGDAAHKLDPWGGQGATQAILDAVDLANVLHELPFDTPEAITRAFKAFYSHRYPNSRAAHASSAMACRLATGRGFMADLQRAITLTFMPPALLSLAMNKMHYNRPIVSFLPPPPDRGSRQPNPKTLSAYKPGELDKVGKSATVTA